MSPGYWRTLKNFQETLMKVYYTAGLKEIAEASGYRGTTLTSLEKCSNFKRTHNFLIQVWEAMYRALILNSQGSTTLIDSVQSILENAMSTSTNRQALMHNLDELISKELVEEFNCSVNTLSKRDEMLQFWTSFLLVDCQAYVYLFLALCGCNWELV